MKTALLVGSRGQDGTLLTALLAEAGVAVVGLDADGVSFTGRVFTGVPTSASVLDRDAIRALARAVVPDEAYYLAAHHHSSEQADDPAEEFARCSDVHVVGLVNVLEALRADAPRCRTFYAGSSHMFGNPCSPVQDESTPFAPRNAYAITKVAGAHACAVYRERYGMHVSVGILYNHESPLRGPSFITQRLVRGARQAAGDAAATLRVGSLSAIVDWGWAPDYVDAMRRIVAATGPDDYVVATGEPHTVREFANLAYAAVGRDYRAHVVEDTSIVKSALKKPLVGNAAKLRAKTGWQPTVTFAEMVKRLTLAE